MTGPFPPFAVVKKILASMVGPTSDFHIGMNSKGKYYTKAPRTLIDFYIQHFKENACKTFVVYQTDRYTFEEVWETSKKLGSILKELYNVKKGDRIALAMRNYPEWCFLVIACSTIGAIAVPINSFWKGSELSYGLKDCGSQILFCDYSRYIEIKPFIATLEITVIVNRHPKEISLPCALSYDIFSCAPARYLTDTSLLQFSHSIDTEDAALMLYTSGTTGNPKGVVLTHRGIMTQMVNGMLLDAVKKELLKLPGMPHPPKQVEQHCVLCVVPLFHGTGSHHNFLRSITIGQKLVLMYKWDPEIALQLIESEKVTTFTGVPTMALDIIEHPAFNQYDTSSVLSISCGGAPTPRSQVLRTAEVFKNGLPATGYGLTETNSAVCHNAAMHYLYKPTSCGRPFPVVEMKVVDEAGNELGPNKRGELLIRSNLVMKGYWNKPEETAKVMTEDGYFRSGDIATVDEEGFIFIVDRAKDIIIRGGENISCTEVENALYSTPFVRECAVFGIPDPRLGEVVGALIRLREAKNGISPAAIISVLRENLSSFKIPLERHIFVTRNPLPRGATGKIQKRFIRDHILLQMNCDSISSKL